MTTVWESLVGQRPVVETLRRAASGHGLTQSWLFTGPPGSGRSNAALAFAAALQCETRTGCGECHACHTAAAGSHPDIALVRTEQLSIGVKDAREMVRRAALAPAGPGFQVIVIEDADRLSDQAANALLKGIEEPTARTIWLLCAPTVEDVLPTIRSRCRLITLSTPSPREVTAYLVRELGIEESRAAHAARASQGHIGRAKALANDEATMNRRHNVVSMPGRLTSLGAAMSMADELSKVTKEEAAAITSELDAKEKSSLDATYGVVERGRRPREYAPALREMEKTQKTRAKRQHLDVIDRGLMDLLSVYRDAVTAALGAPGELVNEDLREDVERLARASTPEEHLGRIDAILTAREQMLEFNVPPALALESMMVALKLPEGALR